jgi:hypothetical protein
MFTREKDPLTQLSHTGAKLLINQPWVKNNFSVLEFCILFSKSLFDNGNKISRELEKQIDIFNRSD